MYLSVSDLKFVSNSAGGDEITSSANDTRLHGYTCLLPMVAALAFDFKRGPVVAKERRQAQRPISIDTPISKFATT